jgi:hypothetical protein
MLVGPQVLRVGDRLRFDGAQHTVVGLSGSLVRLVADDGSVAVLAVAHLLDAADFAIVGASPRVCLPQFALLDTLPEKVVARARWWERHVVEVDTGTTPDAGEDARPRPEYDPSRRNLAQREEAKAAELSAQGHPCSRATIRRRRRDYAAEGVWGLVDRRSARESAPFGRGDPRVVGHRAGGRGGDQPVHRYPRTATPPGGAAVA